MMLPSRCMQPHAIDHGETSTVTRLDQDESGLRVELQWNAGIHVCFEPPKCRSTFHIAHWQGQRPGLCGISVPPTNGPAGPGW